MGAWVGTALLMTPGYAATGKKMGQGIVPWPICVAERLLLTVRLTD